MRKKVISSVSVFLLFTMVFAGCGGDGGASSGDNSIASTVAHSKTFNVASGSDIYQIDPHNMNGMADRTIIKMCYEPLVDGDHYGNYYGVLAESWEFNEDCRELTFRLKEGIQFSNGESFNADVVMYNIERLIQHSSDFAVPIQFFYNLVGSEKIDENTVKMIFSQPSPIITSHLGDFLIIPMEMHKELGDQMFNDINNSGTGPWIWDEWVSGQYAHFTKNPNYRDKATYDSYFDDGYIRFVSEPTSAAGAHIAGDVDAYIANGGIGYDVLSLYSGTEDRIDIIEKKDMTSYLCMRLGYPENSPWYDAKVREALNLAIDRQLIADQITGTGRVPTEFFVEGVVGHDPTIPPYEFDSERAKQLLDDSSYNGEELKLLSYPSMPNPEDYALALTSMLQDVGFNIKPMILDMVSFSEERDKADWSLVPDANLWTDGNPGPTFMNIRQDGMHANWRGSDAEKFYVLGDSFLMEPDADKREKIAIEANNLFSDRGCIVPIAMMNAVWAQSKGMTGIVMFPDNFYNITYIDWDLSAVE
jgi:ABC-type transport system substrate-binding protein